MSKNNTRTWGRAWNQELNEFKHVTNGNRFDHGSHLRQSGKNTALSNGVARQKKLRGLLNAVLRLAAGLVHDLFLRVTDR